MTPVVWLGGRDLCWDQSLLGSLIDGELWRLPGSFSHHDGWAELPEGAEGAVVVVPARYHVDRIADLNAELGQLSWCLVVLTSDEESLFPWKRLSHPRMRLWAMTPRPEIHAGVDRTLGEGWQPKTPEIVDAIGFVETRPLDWYFAGQITHERRYGMAAELEHLPNGVYLPTESFTAGVPQADYLAHLTHAKVAPCPGGPATPDSFRLFEALEAGAVPIADDFSRDYQRPGYWRFVLGETPFPVLEDWSTLPKVLDGLVESWPAVASRTAAWWKGYKRELAYALADDVATLSGRTEARDAPDEQITVLIPTSPIPSHPSTEVIEETLASVRAHLPTAEIIVMADGVRPEQEDQREAYEDYLHRLSWICRAENVWLTISEEHEHQVRLTRAALKLVRTPLILFVEHDTPLTPDRPIEWAGICEAVLTGRADLVRFMHEAQVLEPHRPMLVDPRPVDICGVPLQRSVQFSARPHVASAAYYRRILSDYFHPDARTFVEDTMHSIGQWGWDGEGETLWEHHRLYLYAPPGDMKRSFHTDGRAGDRKFGPDLRGPE